MVQTQEARRFEFLRFVEENDISLSKLKEFQEGINKEVKRLRGLLIVYDKKTGPVPESHMDDDQYGSLFVPVYIDWRDTVNPLMFFYQDPIRDNGSMFKYVRTAKTFEDLKRYLASWVSVLVMVEKHLEYAILEMEEREEHKPFVMNTFFIVTLLAATAGVVMFVINYLSH
jgi:hypothetical protein